MEAVFMALTGRQVEEDDEDDEDDAATSPKGSET